MVLHVVLARNSMLRILKHGGDHHPALIALALNNTPRMPRHGGYHQLALATSHRALEATAAKGDGRGL
jgi:hypothetical protein